MTNAEWLIQNKIPFQNINIHIDYIKGIANIYIKDYEKIVYNLEPNDPNDETRENFVNTFSVLRFFESWLDNEVNEMLFVKKILNKKEKNWIVILIKPFYQKIEHLMDIEVMRHVKYYKIENDLIVFRFHIQIGFSILLINRMAQKHLDRLSNYQMVLIFVQIW